MTKKINKLQISKFQILTILSTSELVRLLRQKNSKTQQNTNFKTPNSYYFVNVCGRDFAALNSLFGGGLDVGGGILGSMSSH
jgi:hypothetical protein